MSGHVYYPDGASFQSGIKLGGWLAFMAKISEGTGYRNPAYASQRAAAQGAGARFGGYHFLHAGNGASQADYCFGVAGRTVPVMIDMEPTAGAMRGLLNLPRDDNDPVHVAAAAVTRRPDGLQDGHLARLASVSSAENRVTSNPSVQDCAQFLDRFRGLGGLCWEVYLPHWYWQQLGSPSLQPLVARGLELVTSDYTGNPENAAAAGWQAYGGMPTVKTWQYTSAGTVNGMADVDVNCFRGSGSPDVSVTVAEMWGLWTTGKMSGVRPAEMPTIAQGANGPAVTTAQQRLNAWGAKPALTADGAFGPATFAAVKTFQHGQGLTADGIIGPATWPKLLARAAGEAG